MKSVVCCQDQGDVQVEGEDVQAVPWHREQDDVQVEGEEVQAEVQAGNEEVQVELSTNASLNAGMPNVAGNSRFHRASTLEELAPEVKHAIETIDANAEEFSALSFEERAGLLTLLADVKKSIGKKKYDQASTSEISRGLSLLEKINVAQANNSSELDFSMLPSSIQEVLKTWDRNGDNKVQVTELAKAAEVWKDMTRQSRLMKRALFVMGFIVVVLLFGTFGLMTLAISLGKDMAPESNGALKTRDGTVVSVSNSDFQVDQDGTLSKRPSENQSATPGLKIAMAEVRRKLSSTMPLEACKELKSLTLADEDVSLGVKVTGFRRVKVRTSKCGSVLRLETPHGEITIDDYDILVDERFQRYATSVGLHKLFDDDSVKAFGRRLSAASMLTGFFNSMPEGGWNCESQPLEAPEELSGAFYLKARMRKLLGRRKDGMSSLFEDLYDDNDPLMLAGIEEEGGTYYRVWEEESIAGMDMSFTLRRYPMYPIMRFLTLQLDDDDESYVVSMSLEEGLAVQCNMTENVSAKEEGVLEDNITNETQSRMQESGVPRFLEFVDLVELDGLILRHFRTYLKAYADTDQLKGLISQGIFPDIYDYYDVDTDPTGKREAGSPYRRISRSSVPHSGVFTEATYDLVKPVPQNFTEADVFNLFNVSFLSRQCAQQLKLDVNDAQDYTNSSQEASSRPASSMEQSPNHSVPAETMLDGVDLIQDALKKIPIRQNSSLAIPVPIFGPWIEVGTAVEYQREKLAEFGPSSEMYQKALQSRYWELILVEERGEALQILADYVLLTELVVASGNDTNETNLDFNSTVGVAAGERRLAVRDELVPGKQCGSGRMSARKLAALANFGFSIDHSSSEFGLSFDFTARKKTLSVEIKAAFPNGRFSSLELGASGQEVEIACFKVLCVFGNAGGSISYDRDQDFFSQGEVWYQLSVGPPGVGGMLNLPKLTFAVDIGYFDSRTRWHRNFHYEDRYEHRVEEISGTVSQGLWGDALAGDLADAYDVVGTLTGLKLGGEIGVKVSFFPKGEAKRYHWSQSAPGRWYGGTYFNGYENHFQLTRYWRNLQKWHLVLSTFGSAKLTYSVWNFKQRLWKHRRRRAWIPRTLIDWSFEETLMHTALY